MKLYLGGELIHKGVGLGCKQTHLAPMRFRRQVAFESIFVAALFLAKLAVKAKLLKSFGLHCHQRRHRTARQRVARGEREESMVVLQRLCGTEALGQDDKNVFPGQYNASLAKVKTK